MGKGKRPRRQRANATGSGFHISFGAAVPPGPEQQTIVEVMSALDAAWFQQHPSARHRLRTGIDGEFLAELGPLPAGTAVATLVEQWSPELRARLPLAIVPLLPDQLELTEVQLDGVWRNYVAARRRGALPLYLLDEAHALAMSSAAESSGSDLDGE